MLFSPTLPSHHGDAVELPKCGESTRVKDSQRARDEAKFSS